MATSTETALDGVRAIAEQHAELPGTTLWVFAHTGVMTEPGEVAAEIRRCVAAVEDHPEGYDDVDEELDRLYELGAWVDSHRIHYHLGHNAAGYLPDEDPRCILDPAEAVEAFLAMLREYADEDDEAAEALLLATAAGDEYPCSCGHDATGHSETQPRPCSAEDCGCEGYQPDWGDDTPNTRATVDAVLTDDPPQPGQDYAMSVVDSEDWRREFFLHVVIVDEDNVTCTVEVVRHDR